MTAANPRIADRKNYASCRTVDPRFYLLNDIMRGDGTRVVSAWKHLPKMDQGLLRANSDQACFELSDMVIPDIAKPSEGIEGLGYFRWVYGPYIELYELYRYDENWPLEALTDCLRALDFPQPEQWAKCEWLSAVDSYKLFKSSQSRRRSNC